MKLLFVLLALGAVGCNGCLVPPNVTFLGPDCKSWSQPLETMAIVGEATTFEIAIQTQCMRSTPKKATTAKVTLTDPAGAAVPFTMGEILHEGIPRQNVAPVTFTATRGGTHHLVVEFEGVPGKSEYDLQAVEKKVGGAEQVVAWSGPLDCVGFTFTSRGTLSCLRHVPPADPLHASAPPQPEDHEVLTHRGQALRGRAFAAQGDVLWRITEQSGMRVLERRVDDGAGFAVTHEGVNATAEGPIALVGDDAWLIDSTTTLLRAHPEADGTFTFTSSSRPNVQVLAMGGDARGLVVWSNDPNTPRMAFVTSTSVGDLKLMAGEEFQHRVLGADGDVVWTQFSHWTKDNYIGLYGFAAFSASGQALAPVTELRADFGGQFADMASVDAVFGFFVPKASIRRDSHHWSKPPTQPFALPKLENGAIVLETFDVGPGYEQLRSATRTHAFAIAMDGKSVKVIDR